MVTKLSAEAAARVAVKKRGGPKARRPDIYSQIFSLAVGEAVSVTRQEWGIDSPPYWMINRMARERGLGMVFKCRTFEDNTGWIIARTK